uniref:Uncharacterized protein n=1 Tax=Tetraselmis chuii TaxID=63592 RepID=A0A7S1X1Z7_9CHLO
MSALSELDKSQTCYMLAFWEAMEASWNPIRSQRVAYLARQRAQASAPKKLLYHLVRCLDHLQKASTSAQVLAPLLFSSHAETTRVSEFVQSFRASMDGAATAAEQSVGSGIHIGQSCVAWACIHEGCSLLFPAAPPKASLVVHSTYTLTPLGLQHLASLTAVLSKSLAVWNTHGVNVFGEMSFLPSTLMWARSMLHLFQWVLLTAGQQTESPQAVHLPHGLHGYGTANGASRPRDGPTAVFSGLLLAQHVGAFRGELLVGCLPATVTLARLLLAEGCCDVLHRELSKTRVVVRGGMPVCAAGSREQCEVDVKHVVCGSKAAKQVAREHREGLLQSVVVTGNPLSLSSVRSPADVADSESLWEAVELWRRLEQEEERADAVQVW